MKAHLTALLAVAVLASGSATRAASTAQRLLSSGRWVAWTGQPATAWEDAFVTGNGRHGTMVTGQPGSERIICVHEELFIRAWDRDKLAVANIAQLMPEVRRLCDAGQFIAAANLACGEARRQLDAMGAPQMWPLSPHPAFDLNVRVETNGLPSGYRRQLDLETGEALTRWADAAGGVEQTVFSSRTHDVNVLRIRAIGGRKLNVTLGLDETPGRSGGHMGLDIGGAFRSVQNGAEPGWLTYHAKYAADPGGYEGLARVTLKGGRMAAEGERLRVTEADEILVVLRITPLAQGDLSRLEPTRRELSGLPEDYATLLSQHAKKHGEMFRRVTLDLGCAAQWATTPTGKMLAEVHEKGATPLFLEQMHAMGRYLLISSSGKYPPPLQGIWGGGWKPAWIGGFVFDSNVNLAIAAMSVGDLSECAESYFGYVERVLPGWRLNARNYLGCRGFLVPHYSDPEQGYLNHFNSNYAWMYWPAGAGWNLMPFYEHAMLTGDREFLRKRVLPLYREMAEFYEDYLTLEKDGFYHVSPGISPENFIPGNQTLLARDCTMDIAVAREVFEHLVRMGQLLKLDRKDIAKWQSYHDKLVPYRINADGALAEWIPANIPDNYAHRHNSHLYPVFPGTEFLQAGANPALLQAARVALDKRFASDTDSAHGLIHVALMAARLHDTRKVAVNLDRFSRRNYVYAGLVTSHNPNHAIYNLDSVLSLQRLLADMMVFSQPGRIELLPACPKDFPSGKLAGIRVHGGHKLDITWEEGKLVSVVIHAVQNDRCELAYGGMTKSITLKKDRTYHINDQLNP